MNRLTPPALVVIRAFGKYERGAMITDPLLIRAILDGGNSACVIVPALPVPVPDTTTTPEH